MTFVCIFQWAGESEGDKGNSCDPVTGIEDCIRNVWVWRILIRWQCSCSMVRWYGHHGIEIVVEIRSVHLEAVYNLTALDSNLISAMRVWSAFSPRWVTSAGLWNVGISQDLKIWWSLSQHKIFFTNRCLISLKKTIFQVSSFQPTKAKANTSIVFWKEGINYILIRMRIFQSQAEKNRK